MVNKCEKCKVPLGGVGYRLIARPFFGVRPGKKKNICNKCENKIIKKKGGNKNGRKLFVL